MLTPSRYRSYVKYNSIVCNIYYYMSSTISPSPEIGIPLHKMVAAFASPANIQTTTSNSDDFAFTMRGGERPDVAERIAELSVPISLATILPSNNPYRLKFKSQVIKENTPVFKYETIPDDLYNSLVDLVSLKSASRTTSSRRRDKSESSGKKRTSKRKTKSDSSDSDSSDSDSSDSDST
jgi:hypothetical protein